MGPEAKLWSAMRRGMKTVGPGDTWARMETGSTQSGVPDVLASIRVRDASIREQAPRVHVVWVELKVARHNAVLLHKWQVRWHRHHAKNRGAGAILAATPTRLLVWPSASAPAVAVLGTAAPGSCSGLRRKVGIWGRVRAELIRIAAAA